MKKNSIKGLPSVLNRLMKTKAANANNLNKRPIVPTKTPISDDVRVVSVVSSNLSAFTYDKNKRTMRIKFNSGLIYEYLNVSQTLANGLERASSHGNYFNRYLKYRKKYIKVSSLHTSGVTKPK